MSGLINTVSLQDKCAKNTTVNITLNRYFYEKDFIIAFVVSFVVSRAIHVTDIRRRTLQAVILVLSMDWHD